MAILLGKRTLQISPQLLLIAILALSFTSSHRYGSHALPLNQSQKLVPSPTTQLQYHRGPLLTAPINIYLTWYGTFSPTHKSAISDFFASFSGAGAAGPAVSTWWRTTQAYKDSAGKPVSSAVKLAGQLSDATCSLGKKLRRSDVAALVRNSILRRAFPTDSYGIYLVITAADVAVERFCVSSCGFHVSATVGPTAVVVAHVGDPSAGCPGMCAWPYAKAAYGPPDAAVLVAPNGVGADGVVMNAAALLAGAATNPRGDGYYQGDRLAPLEAASACAGIFGPGAYPGFPGELKVDPATKASFNAYGANGRRYLLPAIWDPLTSTCKALV